MLYRMGFGVIEKTRQRRSIMTFEQDTVLDFIEWLEEKEGILLTLRVQDHKGYRLDNISHKKLMKLISKWSNDTDV
jgi:hypothetical protein